MNKTSKTYKAVHKYYSILLNGKMLAIDPSTGSKSSVPGFAWFENGELIESGTIEVNIQDNRSKRLYEIARTVREEFEMPDILVVEYIPPVSYSGGMNGVSLMGLQKAIGAIVGARPFNNLLEIPASAWRNYKPPEYEKTDEWDAITIGLCAVEVARQVNADKL